MDDNLLIELKDMITKASEYSKKNACSNSSVSYEELLKSLNIKLIPIDSGSYGIIFLLYNNDISIILKLSLFTADILIENLPDKNRPEYIELHILEKFKDFNICTPHIGEIYDYIICDKIPLLCHSNKSKIYDNFNKKVTSYSLSNKSIILYSKYAQHKSLRHLLKNHNISEIELYIISFQIIYTLAHIFKKIPSYRHNDLTTSNILIYADENYDENDDKYYIYIYDNIYYKIPVIKYVTKIWDFSFSNIAGEVHNKYALIFNKIGIYDNVNRYYDIHLLFSDIMYSLENYTYLSQMQETFNMEELLKYIIPVKYRPINNKYVKNMRMLLQKEYTTPHDIMIHTRFFNMFKMSSNTDLDNIIKIYGTIDDNLNNETDIVNDNNDNDNNDNDKE